MTPPGGTGEGSLMDAQEAARQVVATYRDLLVREIKAPPQSLALTRLIATALQQVERETWEAAARVAGRMTHDECTAKDHCTCLAMAAKIQDACRHRALRNR